MELAINQPVDQKQKILSGLNDAQKEVVLNYKGFSMVSAGPGSGKSFTIVQRTAYMIEDGVPASSILLFTFTKKAANELKDRVQRLIGDKACGVTVSTYHSFCARQLRKYCQYVQYKDNFTIIDDDDQKKLLDKILEDVHSNAKSKDMIVAISHLKEKHWTPQQAAMHIGDEPEEQELLLIYERYQKALRQNNVMDFNDLLFHMVTILEKYEIVRHQLHNRYQYVVADECQDSSVIDTKMILYLMNPKTMNLCLVGDSDQSIYSFRGADVEFFFNTINKIPHKNFVLGQNYRSTPEIVEAAQSLIQYNNRPDAKTIFSKNEHGEKIVVMDNRNSVCEADRIARMIRNLVRSGQMKYRDAAVLYRNSFISRNIEDSFCRNHVPYQIVGGMSFYKRKEIKDLLSFLTFIENPSNLSALSSIINIPKNGIGEKTVEKIIDFTCQEYASYATITLSRAIDILDSMQANDKMKTIAKKVQPFIKRCKKVQSFMETNDNVADVIGKVLSEFDYGNYLRSIDEDTCDERMMNVIELENMARGYASIQEFLEDVLTVNPEDESEDDSEKDAVQCMTMHASKGLEFRIVFIVSANAKIIPSWRCQSEKDIQEERRLFYVAMTRAKENLVISSTNSTLVKGRNVPAHPSSFIAQIDPKYIICDD